MDFTVSYSQLGKERRSEEHTSELQSQSNLVCRLLLEKKKRIGNMQPSGAGVWGCVGRASARTGTGSVGWPRTRVKEVAIAGDPWHCSRLTCRPPEKGG